MHTQALAIAASTLLVTPAIAQPAEWNVIVDRHTAPLIDAGLVPGMVVAIHKNDQTAFYPVGSLTPGGDNAPTADTLYEIGSITKVFTALLLADADRRGELEIDGPLADSTPEGTTVPTFEDSDTQITLRHLASHTSGLPRLPANFAPADITNPYADFTEANAWQALAASTLATKPGTTYAYSNYATGLLGTILANAAGTTYEDLLDTRIFTPLGMTTATIILDKQVQAKLAPPHASSNLPDHNWTFKALAGAGAIRASARDMITFAEKVLDADVQPLDALVRETTRNLGTVAPNGHFYGTGWMIARDGSTLFHGGQTGGYHASLFISPPLDASVVVLSNGADGHVSAVAEKLVQSLAGLNPEPLTFADNTLTDAQLQRLVGIYDGPFGIIYHITHNGGSLFARIEGQPALRVWPDSPTEFTYREVEARIVFETNADEPAAALTLFQNGQEFRCERR
ncbi:MAG: serine hydrolase domain-containing protein [Planctomycetota bacterium]